MIELISWKKGKVSRVLEALDHIQELDVEVEGTLCCAWNFPLLTGDVSTGDYVYLNTTAVEKKLGSGGYHFVIANLSRIPDPAPGDDGHIMKLRYTPYQVKVLSVEEEASPFHQQIKDFESLEGTPVIVGTLHSMLAPAAAGCLAATQGRARVAPAHVSSFRKRGRVISVTKKPKPAAIKIFIDAPLSVQTGTVPTGHARTAWRGA